MKTRIIKKAKDFRQHKYLLKIDDSQSSYIQGVTSENDDDKDYSS